MALIRKHKTTQEKNEETMGKTSAQIVKEIAKAKGIISAIGDGINIVDTKFRVIYQNQVHKDMMGVHVGELCYEAYGKRQDICNGCPVALTFKDGQVHLAQRLLNIEKGTSYVEIAASPLMDSTGNIVAGIEIVRDVTERRQAEIALQYSEERYRSTIDFLDDALHVADRDLTIILMNKKLHEWHRRFGLDGDATGKNIFQAYPFLPATVREEYERVFKAGIPITTEESMHIDGKLVITETKKMPIIEGNSVIKVITIMRDITERKAAEEALRTSEAELYDNYFAQSAINMILSESLENIPLEKFLQQALDVILSIPWIAFEAIGSISLVDDKTVFLIMKAQSNIPEPIKKLCARVPFGKCLCGKAAQTQKSQFADHIDERHETCYEGMFLTAIILSLFCRAALHWACSISI